MTAHHLPLEYIAARRTLLDALEALGAHLNSLVLVGAQAVYLHTGDVEGTGIATTTDSDLAIDIDLLAAQPLMPQVLEQANFASDPAHVGQWTTSAGIRIDLMTVPHQSKRPPGKRAANVPPHGTRIARITPGLEATLIDNATAPITALEAGDDRSVDLRVAGPAALIAAKLTKLEERLRDGNPARLKDKDAVDCYRLLRAIETESLCEGFNSHRHHTHAYDASRSALAFFLHQHRLGEMGVLHTLLKRALPEDPVTLASFDALSEDLLDSLTGSGWELDPVDP